MQELGSDFWKAELKSSDVRFLLSGRSALEHIIRDILMDRTIDSVLMPSYCCHTMIEPFLLHGIEIRFYNVFCDTNGLRVEMPEAKKREIIFFMRYFGYQYLQGLNIEELKTMENIIIEDCTHSWLNQREEVSDYSFISYRKWTGGGSIALAKKRIGKFQIPFPEQKNSQHEELKKKAEFLKQRYIEKNKGNKKTFLEFLKSQKTCWKTMSIVFLLMNQYVSCAT